MAIMPYLNSGEYYVAIIIPEKIQWRYDELSYYRLNPFEIRVLCKWKKNAVAPKITDKGMTVIQDQVNSSFINTITDTLLNYADVASSELGIDGNTLVESAGSKIRQF